MLLEKYDLYLNPPQWRWEELVTEIGKELPWKISFHDYDTFLNGYGRDKFKFLVAVDKESGNAVSCVYGVFFPSQQGSHEVFTIGMYYTHPKYRSCGLGQQLFRQITACANGCNMFLNSAPNMVHKYSERSGFKREAAWKVVSLLGEAKDCDLSKLESWNTAQIIEIDNVDFAMVEAYDQSIAGGIKRGNFLRKWFTQADAFNKVRHVTELCTKMNTDLTSLGEPYSLDSFTEILGSEVVLKSFCFPCHPIHAPFFQFAINQDGTVIGYCNARIVHGNHVALGPFYADNPETASGLLKCTLAEVPDLKLRNKISAYVSDESTNGVDMFNRLFNGNAVVDRVIPRLFTNHIIRSTGKKIYAVTDVHATFV